MFVSISRRFMLALMAVSVSAFALEGPDRSPYALGGFHRAVTTASAEAQQWFDRGLALCYAFNHEEAIRCFEKAGAADPDCAMVWWGIAYASGPNINNTAMDEAAVARAQTNLAKAKALKSGASAVEQALIDALDRRYAVPAPKDRKPLNRAYAEAMRAVARDHGDDADVTALLAEAMIDGEIAYRRGNFESAFRHLREAVARDDALHYDEPWGWMQPARHALGALLLERGKVDEAERVYREDLERHPKNVWSLHGLAECLERREQKEAAGRVRQELEKACVRSDVAIKASCYCRLGAQK